jgi:cysteine synthase A
VVIQDVRRSDDRAWVLDAVRRVQAEQGRSAETHVLHLPLSFDARVDVYLKDESTHPTGSLKHRLARALVLYGLVNGRIREGTTLVDASSGSTAVSEAHFAQLLGLPFVAVLPRSTSAEKVRLIEQAGGLCHFVTDAWSVYDEAARVAHDKDGYYLNQFELAERALDWRDGLVGSLLSQLRHERHPVPSWIVVGAGTGSTSATIGRALRHRQLATQLCVVDPEGSAFFPGWESRNREVRSPGSRIEGIGRPRVEPSFVPEVVDRMIRVPDAASVAAARWLTSHVGWSCGASTGTNLVGALHVAHEMRRSGETGSIVTLLCDRGDRYADSCYDDDWVAAHGLDLAPWDAWVRERT